MGVITYPATPYHKLKRQQLLTLAYALEAMRDRAIERADAAESEVQRVLAAIKTIQLLAGAHANAFNVTGDTCREKAWLDILEVIERAGI